MTGSELLGDAAGALGWYDFSRDQSRMILAIDQGTSGTTCLVVDESLTVRGRGQRPLETHFPHPGWVEHDPDEIWQSVARRRGATRSRTPGIAAATSCARSGSRTSARRRCCGSAARRDPSRARSSGRIAGPPSAAPSFPATSSARAPGSFPTPTSRPASSSGCSRARRSQPPTLAFGTIDSWLVWKLTDGRMHATDHTNASRTMLLDLDRLEWDDELLALFGVDRSAPARPAPVVGRRRRGADARPDAADRGHRGRSAGRALRPGCFHPGQAKATYGTGSFVLAHVGSLPGPPRPRACSRPRSRWLPGRPPEHALEGAILASGAAIQWLRDGLGLIADAAESETLARAGRTRPDGVYLVPALDRPRLAALGSRGARPDQRHHARDDAARTSCARRSRRSRSRSRT